MAGLALRGEVLSPPTRLDSDAELFHGLTPTAGCGFREGGVAAGRSLAGRRPPPTASAFACRLSFCDSPSRGE